MTRPPGCTCEWEGLLDGPSGDRVAETRGRPDPECPVHGDAVVERPAERVQVVRPKCSGRCVTELGLGGYSSAIAWADPFCPAHGAPGDRLP